MIGLSERERGMAGMIADTRLALLATGRCKSDCASCHQSTLFAAYRDQGMHFDYVFLVMGFSDLDTAAGFPSDSSASNVVSRFSDLTSQRTSDTLAEGERATSVLGPLLR
jgi:hypothetical protein